MKDHTVEELSVLRKGVHSFQASGYSFLKVTRQEEGKQKVVSYKIPIRSQGISELIERLQANEPRPPSTKVLVKPEDEVGRQMRLNRSQWVQLPDFTDPKYMEEIRERENDAVYQIVSVGLQVELQDDQGEVVETYQEKIAVLKHMGFSMQHFTQLANDIRQLTEWSEGEQDNFFDNSLGATPKISS